MYQLYKTTKSSQRSIAPKEIKLLKHLLNIIDPEERFSALATAFSPGDEHEAKDPNALYTWEKIILLLHFKLLISMIILICSNFNVIKQYPEGAT